MSTIADSQLADLVPLYRFTKLVADVASRHMVTDAFKESRILTRSQIEFMAECLQNAATLALQAISQFEDKDRQELLSLAAAMMNKEDAE